MISGLLLVSGLSASSRGRTVLPAGGDVLIAGHLLPAAPRTEQLRQRLHRNIYAFP